MTKFFLITAISIFGLLSITSCSLERKVAMDYALKKDKEAVLLIRPNVIFKDAKDDFLINNGDTISHYDIKEKQFFKLNLKDPKIIDSLLLKSALYLNYLKDKEYLDTCFFYFKKGLEDYGYKVYTYDQLDDFLALKDTNIVIKLAQLQLEQKVINSPDAVFDMAGRRNDFKVKVNSIAVNAWFELERTKMKDEKFPVLYTSHSLSDYIDGYLNNNTFYYRRDSISREDLKQLPKSLGNVYAGMFHDYLMNLFVIEHMPAENPPLYYYTFDKNQKLIIRATDGRYFTELNQVPY